MRSSQPWQAALFAIIGAAGFLLILTIGDFTRKHTQSHPTFTNYVWLAIMVMIPIGLVFSYRTSRQVYPAAIEMVKNLRWYHWLWFAIFVSGLVLRKRTAAEGMNTPVDSAAAFRIVLSGGVGVVLLAQLFLRKVEWLQSAFTGIVGLLMAFDLVALVSCSWSIYWQWTFYKSVEYGVDVCLLAAVVYAVRNTKDYRMFFDWNWVLFGIMLLNVWFGCVWDPGDALLKGGRYGVQGIGGLGVWLQGVFPDVSSNQLSEYAGCIAVVALCRLLPLNRRRENTAWYVFVFLFGFVTMIFGQTRSALGGFCIALFLIYLLSNRVAQGAAIVIGSIAAVFATGFGEYILDYLKRGQSTSQLESFSSRLNWWEAALHAFMNYPLTGMGMWAAGRFGVLAKIGKTLTSTVHSDWIEIIVGTGIWGLVPIALVIIVSWYVLVRCTINKRLHMEDRQLAYEGMAALSVLTARMFFMTDLTLHPPSHFLVVLGCAEFLRRRVKKGYTLDEAPAIAVTAGV